jgi:predicted ATP-dependent serine protease
MFAPKAGDGDLPIAPAVGGAAVQGNSMAKPVVIVVGADKGGVGKTTVSRTLLDYFSANNVPTRAFDTESPRGTLMRFHPDITEIVDMTTTSDQMKIFDTLNAASPSVTVIDVRAGLLSPALASLRSIYWAPRSPRWTKSPRPRTS